MHHVMEKMDFYNESLFRHTPFCSNNTTGSFIPMKNLIYTTLSEDCKILKIIFEKYVLVYSFAQILFYTDHVVYRKIAFWDLLQLYFTFTRRRTHSVRIPNINIAVQVLDSSSDRDVNVAFISSLSATGKYP